MGSNRALQAAGMVRTESVANESLRAYLRKSDPFFELTNHSSVIGPKLGSLRCFF